MFLYLNFGLGKKWNRQIQRKGVVQIIQLQTELTVPINGNVLHLKEKLIKIIHKM